MQENPMADVGDLDPFWMHHEAIEAVRNLNPSLADEVILERLTELCRLHGVRAIGRRCDRSRHPILSGWGKPRDEFEPIPAHDWADLRFGIDEGEQATTDDLHSVSSKRRLWAFVQFSKTDLMRALSGAPETMVGTNDAKAASQPRPLTPAVAEMTAKLQQLERDGQIKPGMRIKEKYGLVLKHLGYEKEPPFGYGMETFRSKVLRSK
jgi:hypothetical protein